MRKVGPYDQKLLEKIEKGEESRNTTEKVQKGIVYWDKQNNDVPAPNYILKVREEIIKVEGL